MNGVKLYVIDHLVKELFDLEYTKKKCNGEEFVRNEKWELRNLNHDQLVANLLAKHKAWVNLNVRAKILDTNDLGVKKKMFNWDLVKCIKPKVHSQTTFTRTEQQVFRQCFMMERIVTFDVSIMENMIATHIMLTGKKCGDEECQKIKGLLYACHFTQVFQHFIVDFLAYQKEKL